MLSRVVLKDILPYIIVIAALVGAYFYIRHDAYNDGVADTTLKYENAIQDERERLSAASEAALREARAKEAELNRLLRERDATISQLEQEANSDPDASRPAISIDGVQRLNRIR